MSDGKSSTATLHTRPGSVGLVMAVADDPDAGVADLARAIGADPVLASSVLRLANSSYYGLSGRIGRLELGVSVLGFTTVRAVALVSALGADESAPHGFWDQAATAATAAGLLAPVLGVDPADAFCLGLLHTFGSVVLHRRAPLPALCLPEPEAVGEFVGREVDLYGTDHLKAGTELLRAWKFPNRLCALIAEHHVEPVPDSDPLLRVLHAARLCTEMAGDTAEMPWLIPDALERVTSGRVRADDAAEWSRCIRARADDLRDALIAH